MPVAPRPSLFWWRVSRDVTWYAQHPLFATAISLHAVLQRACVREHCYTTGPPWVGYFHHIYFANTECLIYRNKLYSELCETDFLVACISFNAMSPIRLTAKVHLKTFGKKKCGLFIRISCLDVERDKVALFFP